MMYMYGHRVGSYARKPHMDTVQAIRRSTINPFVTSPAGVPIEYAQPRGGYIPNILNADRILMGDYGQVGGSDSFAAAYPDSAAAVPAPVLRLRNTPVLPAEVSNVRSSNQQSSFNPASAAAAAGGITAAAAAAAAAIAPSRRPMVPPPILPQQSQQVQSSRQTNQTMRASAAAAARAPPQVAQQVVPNPRNMAATVTATAPVSSVRVSDGGGAVRSEVVSSATERVQQLYNLSDNDIQNIMRIIQAETSNTFLSQAPNVSQSSPPTPILTRQQPLQPISETEEYNPVVSSVPEPTPTPVPSSSRGGGRPNPQQRLAEMRQSARSTTVQSQNNSSVAAGGEAETKSDV